MHHLFSLLALAGLICMSTVAILAWQSCFISKLQYIYNITLSDSRHHWFHEDLESPMIDGKTQNCTVTGLATPMLVPLGGPIYVVWTNPYHFQGSMALFVVNSICWLRICTWNPVQILRCCFLDRNEFVQKRWGATISSKLFVLVGKLWFWSPPFFVTSTYPQLMTKVDVVPVSVAYSIVPPCCWLYHVI